MIFLIEIIKKRKNKNKMNCVKINVINETVNEEEDDGKIRCIHCKKEIIGKPWITVSYPEDNYTVHGCNYICSNRLSDYIGNGYWANVVNKEDFPGPRPVFQSKIKRDITVNFGIEDIRREIEYEEERINQIEAEYDNSSESSDCE